jgi:hypothetical protein
MGTRSDVALGTATESESAGARQSSSGDSDPADDLPSSTGRRPVPRRRRRAAPLVPRSDTTRAARRSLRAGTEC